MASVLLLAQDDFVGTVLHACLSDAGHTTRSVLSVRELFQEVRGNPAAVVVVEVAAPDAEAEALCRRLVALNAPPLMLAIAGGGFDAAAEARLLRAGADEVVWAPFYPEVFTARLEVLCRRRTHVRDVAVVRPLVHDGIVVDLVGRRAWAGETELSLTRVEFDLLATLASAPHRVHSRVELAYAARIRNADGALDPHLSRLRRKVRDAGGPRVAVAVHRSGFRLTGAAPQVSA
jgi:DNA-binding response OmpR family regulator